jgi:hypothetical protein
MGTMEALYNVLGLKEGLLNKKILKSTVFLGIGLEFGLVMDGKALGSSRLVRCRRRKVLCCGGL